MLFLLLLGNFLTPKLITHPVMFCAPGNQSLQKSVELLCIVTHNKLGSEPTTQEYSLHLGVCFYGVCFYNLPLGWTPTYTCTYLE